MGQMVGITHVSIREAKFDPCLNLMYVSPGSAGLSTTCVCFQGLCDLSCVAFFLSEVFFTFPSFAI